MANFVKATNTELWLGLSTDTKPVTDLATGATLAEALDDSETGVDVSDGTLFKVNRTYKVDDEEFFVLSIATNTLTVVRGVNTTVAAAHLIATAITERQARPQVLLAYETNTGDFQISKDGGDNWSVVLRGDQWPIF